MPTRVTRSRTLFARAARILPGGVDSPVRAFKSVGATPRFIERARGARPGHADAFLVQAGSGALTLGTPTSPGVTRAAAADTLLATYNDLDSVQRVFDANRGRIAALIVEPIAGNMGVVPPADGFLRALRDVCTANRTLLVFDEVISGFRAAPGGAQGIYDVRPDLTCLDRKSVV